MESVAEVAAKKIAARVSKNAGNTTTSGRACVTQSPSARIPCGSRGVSIALAFACVLILLPMNCSVFGSIVSIGPKRPIVFVHVHLVRLQVLDHPGRELVDGLVVADGLGLADRHLGRRAGS